ncbi:unnamed protein product [Scytosiphon promiscuus]
MADLDTARYVAEFVEDNQFLFFASVSTVWRRAWPEDRPAATEAVTATTSVPQLSLSFDSGLGLTPDICRTAAKLGRLDLLECAREAGCPWDAKTCSEAAAGGHLEVLQFARRNGCPWDEWTCAKAAWGEHLSVFQWARANGCPWDEWTFWGAGEDSNSEVLRWARQGCPFKIEWLLGS